MFVQPSGWVLAEDGGGGNHVSNSRLRKAEVQLSFCVTRSHRKLPRAGNLSKPPGQKQNQQAPPKA